MPKLKPIPRLFVHSMRGIFVVERITREGEPHRVPNNRLTLVCAVPDPSHSGLALWADRFYKLSPKDLELPSEPLPGEPVRVYMPGTFRTYSVVGLCRTEDDANRMMRERPGTGLLHWGPVVWGGEDLAVIVRNADVGLPANRYLREQVGQ